ncbi:MAG: carbohydrate kinase, partial [Leifsonia sp.]
MTLAPVLLPANQPPDRFYRGGPRIAEFRGERGAAAPGDHVPEDWVASVTTQAGENSVGLTTLPDGRLLRSAVAADPLGWLGPAHVDAFGADPRLLVKLLDPGQRLPVHAHPDDAWAAAHLGHSHGKAEAWCILEPGEVFLGLRETISPERLLDLV